MESIDNLIETRLLNVLDYGVRKRLIQLPRQPALQFKFVPLRKRHKANSEMARFRPANSRFCQEWPFVVWQGELNLHIFSGAERNGCTYGHAPFADVYAAAANVWHRSSAYGDGDREGTAEIAASFSQYQSEGRLERAFD